MDANAENQIKQLRANVLIQIKERKKARQMVIDITNKLDLMKNALTDVLARKENGQNKQYDFRPLGKGQFEVRDYIHGTKTII
jgi:hypothetical protein